MTLWRCLPLLLALGCGDGDTAESEDPMPSPPWHLWGNQLPVRLVSTGAPATVDTQTLVTIAYGRPETWTWLFWYQIIADSGAGNPGVLQLRFNLTTGVGRTKFTRSDFVLMINGPPLPVPTQSYTTSTIDGEGRTVTDLVGQDIVLNVNSVLTGGAAPGTTIDLVVGAIFAPKTHVRPDWLVGHFDGDELGGK